jgi:hypothetical protein
MSNNEQWSRELENLLSGYVNELLRNTLNPTPPVNPVQQPPIPPETSDPVERITNRRYYTLLTEMIHDYNANIRLYQENIRELIQCVHRAQPLQTSLGRNTQQYPVGQAGLDRPMTQTPITTTTLFSYILQPNATAESVGLTAPQIQSSTTNVPYSEDMNETRCPISLEDFEIGEPVCKIIACGHFFKRQPLMHWFSRNSHCPVCRGDVLRPQTPADNTPLLTQTTRRVFGPEPPPTVTPIPSVPSVPSVGVPLFTTNALLQNALMQLQSPVMDEVNAFLRNLGNTDASFNEVD